jgi:hypothetical protein
MMKMKINTMQFNVIKEMDIVKRKANVIKKLELIYRAAEYSPFLPTIRYFRSKNGRM